MGSSIINIGDPAASSTAPVTVVTVRGSEASGQPTAIDQDLEDMILENETALRSALSELASAREAQDEDLMSQVQCEIDQTISVLRDLRARRQN